MNPLSTFYDHVTELSRQQGISLAEALSRVREMGVDRLEVSEQNLGPDPDKVAGEIRAQGLAISTVPAFFDFGNDPDVDGRALPLLRTLRALGVTQMLVIPGFISPEVTEEKARAARRDAMAAAINRLATLAEPMGVALLMEDFDNAAAPFSTAEGVRGFLDDCPALSACFDTGNFRFMAGDELKAYDLLRDRVRYVHLKDRAYTGAPGERGVSAVDGQVLYASPVGAGEIRMRTLLQRLRADGYTGPLAIEHYGAPDMEGYLRRSVQWLRSELA